MTTEKKIEAFSRLGLFLSHKVNSIREEISMGKDPMNSDRIIESAVYKAHLENPWFTIEHILFALNTIALFLEKSKIQQWIERYESRLRLKTRQAKIAVIMAGNIPLVGFHDFFCVLMAGDICLAKLSSDDSVLLPAIADILFGIEPGFSDQVVFTKERSTGFDAIIATGSNNTFRYFDYYFGKYPHIFRNHRNAVAILTGNETETELAGIADDVFLYFGKGCRSVSKIYIPVNYNLNLLKSPFEKYSHFFHHHKYRNNYDYYKAIFGMSSVAIKDFGFIILKEEQALASPIAILNYEYYEDLIELSNSILGMNDLLQCVTFSGEGHDGWIRHGYAQITELWDYADGVDTMEFLLRP
jgi:hypothetical protein